MLSSQDRALGDLLGELEAGGYRFVTPTPQTHARVIAKRGMAEDLRDIFGWSLPFAAEVAGQRIISLLDAAGMALRNGSSIRSAVRVSSVGDALFLHSAFPTTHKDAVFFGPDSYRFVDFLRAELAGSPPVRSLIDIGTGSGVGGIVAAMAVEASKVTLIDINPLALRFARINAAHNGVAVETVEGSGVDAVAGPIGLAVSNPPYLMDAAGRSYRDGGAMHGAALSLEWALTTASKLAPGGRLLLYTASAIVNGHDNLKTALSESIDHSRFRLSYRELDPDVFGEQLEEAHYRGVERIAVVGAVIERPN